MPPLPLLPNQPTGSPDWYPTMGYGPSSGSSSQGDAATEAARWDEYVAYLRDFLQKTSGWEREKYRRQLEDAEKGRQNAYRIAQLQARTSRYGTDRNFEAEMARLKENQRQFDANHGLEQQKFGLSVAEAYTRYSQTPDMVWALNDFKGALGRVGVGQGPQPIASNPAQPKAKTWEDFAALSGYTGVPAVQAGASPAASGASGVPDMAGAAAGGGTDPRIKAMRAVADAIPPSETPGNDEQDWAALNAIRSLYFSGRPGEVEKLGAARRKTAQAGLARLGHDPALVEEERNRSLPWQQSVRAA